MHASRKGIGRANAHKWLHATIDVAMLVVLTTVCGHGSTCRKSKKKKLHFGVDAARKVDELQKMIIK